MGLSPDILYTAVQNDVLEYLPSGPVGLGDIPPDASYKQYASSLLLGSLLKKWVPKDTKLADLAAKEKFLASNKKCSDWNFHPEWESDMLLYGEYCKEVNNFLHFRNGSEIVSSFKDILDRARCGPGASIGSKSNSMYAKLFSSKGAVTSLSLYKLYRNYIEDFPVWKEAEVHRHSTYGYPKIVDSSKTTFVPKTKDISRMVCTEPSLNMYFQLGLGTILEDRLRYHYEIDLSTQPERNRRLAYLGSLDNQYSTIDLSSASDSISLNFCKKVFPSWFFGIISDLRVQNTILDGEKVSLNMISTMGNGFTFPLQTFIFSALIRTAYNICDIPIIGGESPNWACFGDDLICDKRAYRVVRRLLSLFGFEANSSKTFSEGPFRESCGTDWFIGQPVRGVYLKQLETPQDICVALNLLNAWSSYTGIPLKQGISYLLRGLRFKPYVPFEEGMNAGIRVPSIFLERNQFRYDRNGTMIYRAYRSRNSLISFDEDGVIRYPKKFNGNLSYNPSGLLLSFLYGEVVSCSISTRQSRVSYKQRLVCTPFWDYKPALALTNGYRVSWQQWETAVVINMTNP